MIPEPGVFLALVLFGGAVGVDGTSFGQFMLSRPIAAATLAGWIAGAPAAGAAVGLILEAIHLTVLPVGAARYPEGGPPAVAAAAVYAGAPQAPASLVVILALTLAVEWVGGLSIQGLRHLNVRLSAPAAAASLRPGTLARRHLLAIGADFLRAAAVTALGLLVIGGLAGAPFILPAQGPARLALGAALAAALAASARLFGTERLRLFAVGIVAGVLVLLATR